MSEIRQTVIDAYYLDETEALERLMLAAAYDATTCNKIALRAKTLVKGVREAGNAAGGIEALMIHYDLSCEEGIMLMCLAEALLRVPDKDTENLLIRDKLTGAQWESHLGASDSKFVNFATWGLEFTKNIFKETKKADSKSLWRSLVARSGEPIVRKIVREMMRLLSKQFVIGRDIEEAIKRSKKQEALGYAYSYDMLGEAARTEKDADEYYAAYMHAIKVIGAAATNTFSLDKSPGISVKLSALHPRYEFAHTDTCMPVLVDRLKQLCIAAKESNMSLTVDAEESYRLSLSLDIIETVFSDVALIGWEGFGLAVQAYQKRAYPLIDWIIDLATRVGRKCQVRLVKGAYWDSEIKWAQLGGHPGYPVFTRKVSTDVSYLACAKKLLSSTDVIYPQFASHNAYTVAAIIETLGDAVTTTAFEFQNLQGMGNTLHDQLVTDKSLVLSSRIYAPVGSHENLLPYLVRRLLENGANSSFVNQVLNQETSIDDLVKNPVVKLSGYSQLPNDQIPLPRDLFGTARRNSAGIDLTDANARAKMMEGILENELVAFRAEPAVPGDYPEIPVLDPADNQRVVGAVRQANLPAVDAALTMAQTGFKVWNATPVSERATILRRAADLMQQQCYTLYYLAIREAGKTLQDAIDEVREAIDFCRYYACIAEEMLGVQVMPGPTGESNELSMHGRGVIAAISPWNFPIAIFAGQVVAALAAGNAVVAKPAAQTCLCAAKVTAILHEAGVPKEALLLMPGPGSVVGASLVEDERVAGVVFTGSNDTAKGIQRGLANREGAIVPLIAETGGMNAMIADSTALHEQLVDDVIRSAFGSAGQRCSALRVLYVQNDIADDVITMLKGAMATLRVGDPMRYDTDIGPVIDKPSCDMLQNHADDVTSTQKFIYSADISKADTHGTFFAPLAVELADASVLTKEVFGPILHIVRYEKKNLDAVIDQINGTGYGLTFGLHTRINSVMEHVVSRIAAGNLYVNRDMIGAVVGVQPFGGSGRSGTGPKAGGPHYLLRFCDEKTVTINTTAAGGNASLMSLGD